MNTCVNEGTCREGKEGERSFTDSIACVVSTSVRAHCFFLPFNAPTAGDRVLELGRNIPGGCLNVVSFIDGASGEPII